MFHHSLKVWGDVYDKYPAKNERRFLSRLSSSSNWQATWGWGGGVAKKHYLIKSEKCPLCSVCSLALVCGAAQFRPKDIMSIENWFKPLNKFRFYLILFLRLSLYRSTLKFNLHLKKQLERGGRPNTIILHSRILNFHDFEIWYVPCYHQHEPPLSLSPQGSEQQLPENENSRIWAWENMDHPGDSPIRAGVGAFPVEPGALVHLKTPGDRRKPRFSYEVPLFSCGCSVQIEVVFSTRIRLLPEGMLPHGLVWIAAAGEKNQWCHFWQTTKCSPRWMWHTSAISGWIGLGLDEVSLGGTR